MRDREAAVIVHFDRPQACLATVVSLRAADPEIEIVVLDNHSSDESWRVLTAAVGTMPAVHVRRLPRNLGYAGAIANADLIEPQLADCETIFFGAHDAVIAQGTLRALAAALAQGGAALAFAAWSSVQAGHWSAIRGPWSTPLAVRTTSEPSWVTGLYFPSAFFAITGAAFRAGVRPDPELFCYGEECDLGLRARSLGLRTVLELSAPTAGTRSAPAASPLFAQFLIARNSILLARWHAGQATAALCAARLLASSLSSSTRGDAAERQRGLARRAGALAGWRGRPCPMNGAFTEFVGPRATALGS